MLHDFVTSLYNTHCSVRSCLFGFLFKSFYIYIYIKSAHLLNINFKFLCLFKHSGHFEKGVAEGAVDPSFNPVLALRLSVLKNSAVWAILSEVSDKYN